MSSRIEPAPSSETWISQAANELRLYRHIVGARIRSDWQFRTSFLTFLLAQGIIVALELVALVILLSLVPQFGGWETAEVIFLYALATLPFSIADIFVSEVERLADSYVRSGDFDSVLLRPSSALMQILALEFELRRAGKLLPPIAALIWAMANVSVDWTAGRLALVAGALVCGTVIYSALWVVAASITFWAVASREATNAMTYGSQFANQYPLHVYPGWIRAIMGWALPLAFVAYVPTIFAVDASNPLGLPTWFVATPPLVAVVASLFARWAWRTGIRHYQSTGS